MRFHFQHFLRAVLLVAFALFFIKLHFTGDITKYINPKYVLMSQIAAGVFVFLFLIQLFRIWENDHDKHTHCPPGCTHDHGYSHSLPKKLISYSIMIFPLMTGYALSPSVLDASIAAKKGTILPQANSNQHNVANEKKQSESEESTSETDSNFIQDDQAVLPNNNYFSKEEYDEKMRKLDELEVIQMKEDIFASYYQTISNDPKDFQGRKVKVSGFVYKEEGIGANQLVISRFIITHCIADASIIGLLTEFEQASEYQQDTWLEIEGTIDVTSFNGVELPLIKAAKWKVIEEPTEPYIYPILTKMTE
ncbi:TIGR03943 family protein [Bacillus sp. V3B]|nr:TIGR03943 family protein [Bacillus sp. V3B]